MEQTKPVGESTDKKDVAGTAATGATTASTEKPTEVVEDVPDPDEDDLDDLDGKKSYDTSPFSVYVLFTLAPDMLDDFSTVKLDSKQPASSEPQAAGGTPVAASEATTKEAPKADGAAGAGEEFSEDEFQKQLQSGMAELLGELEKSVRCKCIP
jgi:peroxin-19